MQFQMILVYIFCDLEHPLPNWTGGTFITSLAFISQTDGLTIFCYRVSRLVFYLCVKLIPDCDVVFFDANKRP